MAGSRVNRRRFLSVAVGGAAAAAAARQSVVGGTSKAPSDKVVCAVLGVRGMGHNHAKWIAARQDAAVAAICDVDQEFGARAVQSVKETCGKAPEFVSDFRRVLDDRSIDAVIIATPNHWHCTIAIQAMAAGKDVYLEKMGSHVFREGQLLKQAARKYGAVVQHGTQMRSSQVTAKARELLDAGVIGEVKMSKAWNLQRHDNLLPQPDCPVPEGVDYDLWLGPAPSRPFNPNRFHSKWIWYRDYGNGDLGGDGIHDIDMARFGLQPETHPVKITAHGSRVDLQGEREFPDNMVVAYHFAEGKVLIYEDRGWTPYGHYGFDSGNAFYGTEGFMVFSRRGYFQVYLGKKEEEGPGMRGDAGHPQHQTDFLDCVRSRRKPIAHLEEAHKSLALVHLGEIAYRTQSVLEFDPEREAIVNHNEANELLGKEYREPWDPAPFLK